MQIDEAMKELEKWDFVEVSHKTSFLAHRKTEGGGAFEVSIDILDAGEEAGHLRYFCRATRYDGITAAANNGASVKEAIRSVHWYDLDK